MRKGFALPLIIGFLLLFSIGIATFIFWRLQTTPKYPLNEPKEVTTPNSTNEIKVTGIVTDIKYGAQEHKDDIYTIKSKNKVYKVIIPFVRNPACTDVAASVLDQVEVYGTINGDELTCKAPNGYVKFIVPTLPITLKSFTDSSGKEKFVVLDFNKEALGNYYNDIYISSKKDDTAGAIKIVNVQGSSLDKSPFISANSGVRYLIIAQYGPGDGQQFTLVDENGKNIGIGLGTMGLGTKIPGMYRLQFGKWIGDITNFTITAISGNGHLYEATFDAVTGKQVGETKQTN